jgi:hypothetical protein
LEIRKEWHRTNAELHNKVPSRARTTAAKLYPGLTDNLTQSQVRANWAQERQKPSRRFKRKPFHKRGIRGDELEE